MTLSLLPDKEDDVLTRAGKIGLIGTVGFWFLFLLAAALFPLLYSGKPEYKTVRITLSSVPVQQTVTEKIAQTVPVQPEPAAVQPAAPAVKAAKAAVPEKKTAQPAKTEPASRPAAQKPAPSAGTAPVQKSVPSYKKSVEDLMGEQRTQSDKNVQWDDSLFADASSTTNAGQSTAQAKQIAGAAALSGTSAAAAQPDAGPEKSSSSAQRTKTDGADASTKAALGTISETKYTQTGGNGVFSQTSVKTGNGGDGKVALEMSDGSSRVLLYPSKPTIRISDENAKKIDSSRTVRVKFKVLAKGNVLLSEITIEPASILPFEIQKEIRDQVSQWRFAQDPSDGYAGFVFTIDFKK